ncbi:hypothetical protein ETAA8_17110 [Anatilimnocola aggregata]|uniref:Uncharacterized protein n=1 Tax=Anatilimnocola aggregata TaxID=2528021 RepID=A0A517Y8S2_9BACT|nr:hypothetical protein ETAA8_17110 [Anatilimnocola aggregata]
MPGGVGGAEPKGSPLSRLLPWAVVPFPPDQTPAAKDFKNTWRVLLTVYGLSVTRRMTLRKTNTQV